MLNWLLLFTMILFTYVDYIIEDRCFVAPSFIVSGVMAISSLFVAINTLYWDYSISLETYLLFIGSVFCFSVGHFLAFHHGSISIKGIKKKQLYNFEISVPSPWILLICLIYSFLVLYLYVKQQFRNASLIGVINSFSYVIQANRYFINENFQNSSYIRLMIVDLDVIVCLFLTILLKYKIKNKKKINNSWIIYVITIIYFLCGVLTTGRVFLLKLGSMIVVTSMYFYYEARNWKTTKVNKKLLRKLLLYFILIIALFRLLGYLSGKSQSHSLYDSISEYIAGGIVCFDMFVRGVGTPITEANGPQLLRGVYNILNMFGSNIRINAYTFPMQHWANTGANIYTSLFGYYYTFGTLGLLFSNFCGGFLYGKIWKRIKIGYCSWKFFLMYTSIFSYYLFVYPIDERFFRDTFTMTTIAKSILITIFTCLIIKIKPKDVER